MSTKSGTLTIIGLGIVSLKVKAQSNQSSPQLLYITGIVFASLRLEEGAKGWVDDQVARLNFWANVHYCLLIIMCQYPTPG